MRNIKRNEKLTKKETAFCYSYIKTGDEKEAALFAGYKKNPAQKAIKLLSHKKILRKIDEFYKEKRKNLLYKATAGYERLAFGNVSDCVKLLFLEDLKCKDLEKMDLFNIASLKKSKEGGMEIKFFSRLEALEKIERTEEEFKNEKDPFYSAIEQGIKNMSVNKSAKTEE